MKKITYPPTGTVNLKLVAKNEVVEIKLPRSLFDSFEAIATKKRMSWRRLLLQAIEKDLAKSV